MAVFIFNSYLGIYFAASIIVYTHTIFNFIVTIVMLGHLLKSILVSKELTMLVGHRKYDHNNISGVVT